MARWTGPTQHGRRPVRTTGGIEQPVGRLFRL